MQERWIQMLEAIAGSATPISANDLVRVTGLPTSTVYRLLSSLLDSGFVEEIDHDKRYVLGLRFVKIALTGKADSHVVNAVSGVMRRLVIDLGETAFLSRYRGGRVDLVAIETPEDPARAYIYPGLGPRPLHACSSAKAILAFLTPELKREITYSHLEVFTEHTKTSLEEIEAELSEVRESGFGACREEIDLGVTSVAVPVNIDRLGSIFALGVVGPANRISNALQERILPALFKENIRAAAAIQHCSVIDAEQTHQNTMHQNNLASKHEVQSV